jgi:hypothetical protein
VKYLVVLMVMSSRVFAFDTAQELADAMGIPPEELSKELNIPLSDFDKSNRDISNKIKCVMQTQGIENPDDARASFGKCMSN